LSNCFCRSCPGTAAISGDNFQEFGCDAWISSDYDDVREIEGSGVALRTPGHTGADCWWWTDHARPVWAELVAQRTWGHLRGPLTAVDTWTLSAKVVVRPHARLETQVEGRWSDDRWPLRAVEDLGGGQYLFGALHAPSLSVTLRQLVVLTPRLTLQAYAQLFTDYGRYGPFYTAAGQPGGLIGFGDLVPGGSPSGTPDFQASALNLSVVLRWEYRLGSTLFLVYTHESAGPSERPMELWPPGLSGGPARDTVLGKWTWYWST